MNYIKMKKKTLKISELERSSEAVNQDDRQYKSQQTKDKGNPDK